MLFFVEEDKKESLDFFYTKSMQIFNLLNIDYSTILDLLKFLNIKDYSIHIILVSLFLSLEEGSLCLKLTNESLHKKIFFLKEIEIDEILNKFLNSLENSDYNKIIAKNNDDYKPLVIDKINDAYYLYFQKYYFGEQRLKNYIDKILSKKTMFDQTKSLLIKQIVEETETIRLNDKQKIAIILSVFSDFLIISGGPGTGKTSIVINLLRVFFKLGVLPQEIKLASPTGRASQRISFSIKENLAKNPKIIEKEMLQAIESTTIHRLLKYNPIKNDFVYNEKNNLPIKVLIVDEVSMVDISLMVKLLSSLEDNTKIIFIGDKDQLPSVDAGCVFSSLIPKDKNENFSKEYVDLLNANFNIKIENINQNSNKLTDRIVILNQSYRSKGQIEQISQKINNEDNNVEIFNSIEKLKFENKKIVFNDKTNCFFMSHLDNTDYYKLLDFYIEEYYFKKEKQGYLYLINELKKYTLQEISENKEIDSILNKIFDFIENSKILTLVKESIFGCNFINNYLKRRYKEKNGNFSGIPILITENDNLKQLYNGDIGVTIIDKTNRVVAVFKAMDKFRFFDYDFLPPKDDAFAITVHKSQGSEYNEILLILPENEENRLLTKEIVYTGLTRAKNRAIIYGTEIVFTKAISQKIEREFGQNPLE